MKIVRNTVHGESRLLMFAMGPSQNAMTDALENTQEAIQGQEAEQTDQILEQLAQAAEVSAEVLAESMQALLEGLRNSGDEAAKASVQKLAQTYKSMQDIFRSLATERREYADVLTAAEEQATSGTDALGPAMKRYSLSIAQLEEEGEDTMQAVEEQEEEMGIAQEEERQIAA